MRELRYTQNILLEHPHVEKKLIEASNFRVQNDLKNAP